MAEYIEREAVIKIITQIICDTKVHHKGRAINRNIKQLPTADVQEVRHGKWIYDCSDIGWANYKCSSCGECFVLEAGTPQENEYNFCPHCGAKMDKE